MSESWPDPEYLRQFREAAKIRGRAMVLKDDALRAAADVRLSGLLWRKPGSA